MSRAEEMDPKGRLDASPAHSPAALWELIRAGQAVYVDVRTPDEFERGHPPGAINVPLYLKGPQRNVLNRAFLSQAAALSVGKGRQWYVGCKTGARAKQAVDLLRSAGFVGVVQFEGGWSGSVDGWGRTLAQGWADSGLPVEEGQADPTSSVRESPRAGEGK